MTSEIKYLEWNADWDTGIPGVDEGHKRFASLINAFLQEISGQMPPSKMLIRLQQLIDEADEEFAREEAVLKEAGYEGIARHADAHNQLRRQIQDMLETITVRATFEEWSEVGEKVWGLLAEHFLCEDAECRRYLRPLQK